ncbi:hypothetical protein BC833DRAFT_641980 [Globomyces pollinis-pini]|nr:hypothetical protein BC833DRAFT_641980 [Globomyces pollinis-pini]
MSVKRRYNPFAGDGCEFRTLGVSSERWVTSMCEFIINFLIFNPNDEKIVKIQELKQLSQRQMELKVSSATLFLVIEIPGVKVLFLRWVEEQRLLYEGFSNTSVQTSDFLFDGWTASIVQIGNRSFGQKTFTPGISITLLTKWVVLESNDARRIVPNETLRVPLVSEIVARTLESFQFSRRSRMYVSQTINEQLFFIVCQGHVVFNGSSWILDVQQWSSAQCYSTTLGEIDDLEFGIRPQRKMDFCVQETKQYLEYIPMIQDETPAHVGVEFNTNGTTADFMDQGEPVFVLPNDEGFLVNENLMQENEVVGNNQQMIPLDVTTRLPNEFPAANVPHEPVMVAEDEETENGEQLLVDSFIGVSLVPEEVPASIVPHHCLPAACILQEESSPIKICSATTYRFPN